MGPNDSARGSIRGFKRKKRKRARSGRIAVVDIGSNTVRLVVYDAPTRLPIPMFNEKAQCELVRGMTKSGRLNPDGVERAISSLSRFVGLSRAMGVDRIELVATAAVREASDGPAFVNRIRRELGIDVTVPSGADEAKLAALGLLSGTPDADGLMLDLGGGSTDLIELNRGTFGNTATLPLGHLRLPEMAGGNPETASRLIADELARVSWLSQIRDRTLYASGGSLRAIARVAIEQSGYPLHVVDNYTLELEEAVRISRVIAQLSHASLERIPGIPGRRSDTLNYAALVLANLLTKLRPKRLVFSGWGMREGQLLRCLGPKLRAQDPLISGCQTLAERTGRFSIRGEEILAWTSPLFATEEPRYRRLRFAACLLSDIGWPEHPDYRAEHSFHRVLRIPFAGLKHPDRVWIALAVFIRYNGDAEAPLVAPVRRLLDDSELGRVRTAGLALRLAHTLSGSAPGLLSRTALRVGSRTLTLEILSGKRIFASETVVRRLRSLARSVGRESQIA